MRKQFPYAPPSRFSFFCAVVDVTVLSPNEHVKSLFYHKYGQLTIILWFVSVMTVAM